MGDKVYLFLLVICLSLLHHEVQAQKANFCNITESYFVEVNKTETALVPKKPGGFNLLDMFSGNKYENVTKKIIGVEKRERVVEDCCKGYKKRDNECIPIYDTPSSTTTTTTTPVPSSTTTTTSAPPEPPPPPPTESVTQATPAPVPSEAAPTEPSSSAAPVAEPEPTTQAAAPEPTPAPEVPPAAPITTMTPAPEPEPSAEPTPAPEPVPSAEPTPAPEPMPSAEPTPAPETPTPSSESPPAAPEPVPTPSPETPVETIPTSVPSQSESIISESSPVQNEPMLSAVIVTTNTAPMTGKPVTTPVIVSYSSSESSTPSNDPTTLKQSEKLIVDDATIESTTVQIATNSSRRRRSIDKSSDSDSIDTIEIFEFESNTIPEDTNKPGIRKADFKLNEKTGSMKTHLSESEPDNIVVSDLTADIEDQEYPWIEILEVLSFGAVIFLLIVTVQMSFDSETFSMWRASSKKVPQEIDSYGEFWVYDSQGNLQEV